MDKLLRLPTLFSVVAVVEWAYAILGLITPPSLVLAVTGWVLTPDGQWLTKLMGVALASQAWVAWALRKNPHLGVAKALAFYQLGSATVDWVMWLVMHDQGIFSTPLGRFWAAASIPTHYAIGILLIVAIGRAGRPERTAS
jgi:hypothetical protein